MDIRNLIIVGLVAIIAGLVVTFLLVNGIVKLPGETKSATGMLKYTTAGEVTNATTGISGGVEKVGSILEEIDRSLS
ncbi:MAG: hypothetical protein QW818_00865 [Candidatus Aenigmatarchaeota archaeon]|nr:hypothetical protein [Candidatus Aenigmarchaeota archaeon]